MEERNTAANNASMTLPAKAGNVMDANHCRQLV